MLDISRGNDPKRVAFANSITDKDVLCVVAQHLTAEDVFDEFDLTFYRSKPCDQITDAEHAQRVTDAANRRGVTSRAMEHLISMLIRCLSVFSSAGVGVQGFVFV